MKKILKFFDRLEDKIRTRLSRKPLLYAVIGGVGMVLFWRGVWHTADEYPFLTGPITFLLGVSILALTGVLFSAFGPGSEHIVTSLKGEKKLEEKTYKEIVEEKEKIEELESTLKEIKKEIKEIHTDLHGDENPH